MADQDVLELETDPTGVEEMDEGGGMRDSKAQSMWSVMTSHFLWRLWWRKRKNKK